MTSVPKKFPTDGRVLAIAPQAIDFSYLYTGVPCNERTPENVAIVTVHGPLEHHATPEWDSYESILERVEDAMLGTDLARLQSIVDPDSPPMRAIPTKAVVLRIDSPGGEAAGATHCYRQLRKIRKKYGIPMFAYANEMAASLPTSSLVAQMRSTCRIRGRSGPSV